MNLLRLVKTVAFILLVLNMLTAQSGSAQTERILAPVITGAVCVPDTVPADGLTAFRVRVHVTDPDSHANLAAVFVDLSPIGRNSRLAMYDDGTNGDPVAGDSVYTLSNITVPSGWFTGDFPLTITAIDLQNDSTQASAWIYVAEPNTSPVVGIVTVTPSVVQANGTMEFSVTAEVIDDNIAAVTVNLYSVGGDSLTVMTDFGGGLYVADDLTIPVGTTPGGYTLIVRAIDLQGLTATGGGDITVVAPYTAPVVSRVRCFPPVIPADGVTEFVITAKITDINGQSDLSSVTLDLTSIGGSSSITMYDDGTAGDTTAFDSVFTIGGLTAPYSVLPGNYTFYITATDVQNLSNSGDITIEVTLGNVAPQVSGVTFTPASVRADGASIFRVNANVDDMNGLPNIQQVYIDLTSIGSNDQVLMFDDGTHGDLILGDGVFTRDSLTVSFGAAAGMHLLTVYADDSGGLSGSNSEFLEVLDPLGIPGQDKKPFVYALHPNFPNPFNPSTTISFDLPYPSHVIVKIYNILGQEVVTLTDKNLPAGRYHIRWDGKDRSGASVASGVYLIRMKAISGSSNKQTFRQTRKMTLIK